MMMDLNSMLNENVNAVDRPQENGQEGEVTEWSVSAKNRTPWDADGYALPINTKISKANTLQQSCCNNNDNNNNNKINNNMMMNTFSILSGKSPLPLHKCSDSRSSLSSFASSSDSPTHSRLSSISTTTTTAATTASSPSTNTNMTVETFQPTTSPKSTLKSSSSSSSSSSSTSSCLSSGICESPSPRTGVPPSILPQETVISACGSNCVVEATSHFSPVSLYSEQNICHIPSLSPCSSRTTSGIGSSNSNNIINHHPNGALSPRRLECSRESNWSLMTPIKEKEISSSSSNSSASSSSSASSTSSTIMECNEEKRRPSSPSDAMLIKRSTKLCLRLSTENHSELSERNIREKRPTEIRFGGSSHNVSHKRALSAPIFHPSTGNHHQQQQQQRQQHLHHFTAVVPSQIDDELTPPNSLHPDLPSPKIISLFRPPATPPPPSSEIDAQQTIKCMYIADCDTGSQLRKAISHIFGRNKICTRQIPSRVWVHYCRKHYQRSRYRNPKEYAKLQCDLVQQQIRRVQDWSHVNATYGRPGVVQDWSISVRKREQKRLDDLQNGRKRKGNSLDRGGGGGAEDEEDDPSLMGGNIKNSSSAVPATAVPEWLLEHCKKGYSTQQILAIFNRLHQEILDDTISTFPDIEILPNITIDQDESWLPNHHHHNNNNNNNNNSNNNNNGYTKRPQHHKRAKSLNVNMNSIYETGDRRTNNSKNNNNNSNNNPYFFCSADSSNLIFPNPRRISSTLSCSSNSSSSSPVASADSSYLHMTRPRISDLSRRHSLLALHSRIDENQIVEDYENFSPLAKNPSISCLMTQQQHQQQQPHPNQHQQRIPGHQNISPIDPGNALNQSLSQQSFHHQRSNSDYLDDGHQTSLETPVYVPMYPDSKPAFREHMFEPNYFQQAQWTIPPDMPRTEFRPNHGRYHSMPVLTLYNNHLPAMREYSNNLPNNSGNINDGMNPMSRINEDQQQARLHYSSHR